MNQASWSEKKQELEFVFRTKTQKEWCGLMEGTDVCFAPVIDFLEAQQHPHNVSRESYIEVDGMIQPRPAPRFTRTQPAVQFGARSAGEDTEEVLRRWGFDKDKIASLLGE